LKSLILAKIVRAKCPEAGGSANLQDVSLAIAREITRT
jgi:hypothetical protein